LGRRTKQPRGVIDTSVLVAGVAGFKSWRVVQNPSASFRRALDWSTTVLGPVEHWPPSLRACISWGPDYTMHYSHTSSEENNKVFGRSQSFVAGTPTNIQFMVKDSKKYAATGGWGFAHFKDGKPGDEAFMKTCFPCHNQAKARDLVFTRYAP